MQFIDPNLFFYTLKKRFEDDEFDVISVTGLLPELWDTIIYPYLEDNIVDPRGISVYVADLFEDDVQDNVARIRATVTTIVRRYLRRGLYFAFIDRTDVYDWEKVLVMTVQFDSHYVAKMAIKHLCAPKFWPSEYVGNLFQLCCRLRRDEILVELHKFLDFQPHHRSLISKLAVGEFKDSMDVLEFVHSHCQLSIGDLLHGYLTSLQFGDVDLPLFFLFSLKSVSISDVLSKSRDDSVLLPDVFYGICKYETFCSISILALRHVKWFVNVFKFLEDFDTLRIGVCRAAYDCNCESLEYLQSVVEEVGTIEERIAWTQAAYLSAFVGWLNRGNVGFAAMLYLRKRWLHIDEGESKRTQVSKENIVQQLRRYCANHSNCERLVEEIETLDQRFLEA